METKELARFILDAATRASICYGTRVSDRIYGTHGRYARQNVMQALTGQKMPQSKCGYNAVREALYARFAVQGECIAERDRVLQENIERAAELATA